MRKKLIAVAVLFIVIMIGYAATVALNAHAKTSAARKVSDTFVSDVLAGKDTDSYALLLSSTQKNTSKSSWQNTVSNIHSSFSGSQPTYQATEKGSTYYAFSYSITSGGAKYQFRVVTRTQSKTWLVESFTSNLQP